MDDDLTTALAPVLAKLQAQLPPDPPGSFIILDGGSFWNDGHWAPPPAELPALQERKP